MLSTLPVVLPGFEHVNRYLDRQRNLYAAKLMPGELYVSISGEMIVTTLGSCVSACIRDRVKGVGGMNHFMLPFQGEHNSSQWGNNPVSSASRYGNWAMEFLINEILKAGGYKNNFEIKLFGGGNILHNAHSTIGKKNIEFVKNYLENEGFSVVAEDLGDFFPRKILYFPDTGAVKVKKLQ